MNFEDSMKIAVIISGRSADHNIFSQMIDLMQTEEVFEGKPVFSYKNIKIYQHERGCIEYDNLDKKIDADIFVFATQHASKSKIPALTCHHIGNWNEAYGGKPKTLYPTAPFYLKQFYLELKQYTDIEITLEATHHGPHISKPAIFVEIGSSETEWVNSEYGKRMARAIQKVFSMPFEEVETCVILGGGHYNRVANKILSETEYSVSHICPKYNLEFFTEEILSQAMREASFVVLDWEGMKDKERIIALLDKHSIKWEKSNKIYN